jgi:hypothetical protein
MPLMLKNLSIKALDEQIFKRMTCSLNKCGKIFLFASQNDKVLLVLSIKFLSESKLEKLIISPSISLSCLNIRLSLFVKSSASSSETTKNRPSLPLSAVPGVAAVTA